MSFDFDIVRWIREADTCHIPVHQSVPNVCFEAAATDKAMVVEDPNVSRLGDWFDGWQRNMRLVVAVVLCADDKINFADIEAGCLKVDVATYLDQHREFFFERSPIPRAFFGKPVGRQNKGCFLVR